MPERDWRLRIHDMTVAIEKIERYTANMTLAEFQADERTVDAVLRNFEIIGEAAGNLPEHVAAAHPHVRWVEDARPSEYCCPRLFWGRPGYHLGNHRSPPAGTEERPAIPRAAVN